jgi:hypothetical protein
MAGSNHLPLYLAIMHLAESSSTVVIALLTAWPGAAIGTGSGGETMLHLAMRCNIPVEAVAAVVKAWPQAVRVMNTFQRTPLHIVQCSGLDMMLH